MAKEWSYDEDYLHRVRRDYVGCLLSRIVVGNLNGEGELYWRKDGVLCGEANIMDQASILKSRIVFVILKITVRVWYQIRVSIVVTRDHGTLRGYGVI
jgi:hypothetical protein